MSRREWTIEVPAATWWITDATPRNQLVAASSPWETGAIVAARAGRLPFLPHAYVAPVVHMPTKAKLDAGLYRPTVTAVLNGLASYGLVPGVEPGCLTLAPITIGHRVQASQGARHGHLTLTIRERAPDRRQQD